MKVFVVEFGEYSDRNVYGVYSTEDRAKVAASSDGDITEYKVDEAFDLYDKGLRPFFVEIGYDGTIIKVTKCEYRSERATQTNMASTDRFGSSYIPGQKFKWNVLNVATWARDEQHAVKIASEHHAEFVAAGWNGKDHFTKDAELAQRLTDTEPGEIEQRILREEAEMLNEGL